MNHSYGVFSLFSMQIATVGLPSLYCISRSNTSFFIIHIHWPIPLENPDNTLH